ncbi:hypothetical protein ACIBG4_40450 [Nonomuraea sp. NPDC050383]|uniref:hypothetical protein n=1 Tax=Nonomuraea sp. NPDC050383 TaxID=3364362 RepID=UPI003790DDFF
MWIVRLTEQRVPFGPFTDEQEAQRFADFLTAEVERLWSPLAQLLSWRDHAKGGE